MVTDTNVAAARISELGEYACSSAVDADGKVAVPSAMGDMISLAVAATASPSIDEDGTPKMSSLDRLESDAWLPPSSKELWVSMEVLGSKLHRL